MSVGKRAAPEARESGVAPGAPGGRELETVEVWTDGACKGNPGRGGWGAALFFGRHRMEMFGGEPSTTNNRMEMTAVVEALKALKRPCRVRLYTDSQYVKNGMTQWIHGWKRNGWKTAGKAPVKNGDLWQRMDELASRHAVEWHWVKGHDGTERNELADSLSNKGVEAAGTGVHVERGLVE